MLRISKKAARLSLIHLSCLFRSAIQNHWRRSISYTHSINTHINQLKEMLSSTNTSRPLNFDLSLSSFHHQRDYFRRGANILFSSKKACRGFDKICACSYCALSSGNNLLLIERICFNDYFYSCTLFVAHVHDSFDILNYFIQFATA